MDLIIVGARSDGGIVGVLDMALDSGFDVIGFVDDNIPVSENILGFQVFGGVESFRRFAGKHVVVSIGENAARRRVLETALSSGLIPVSLVHSTAFLGRRVTLGDGALIHPGVVVISGTSIGRGVIVNSGATIDHDNDIGDFVNIGPGCHTAGRVAIDDDVFVGTGAVFIPDVHVGRGSVVGAGAVVIRDVPAGCKVVGNPARIIR